MDHSHKRKVVARKRRVMRVRKRVRGTTERPRLSVSKTNKHLYAQLIDDEKGISLAGAGTLSKENRTTTANKKSKQAAREIGTQIALLAKKHNINAVVFDRGVSKFHGVIAELATAAREAGLQF
jgi:large subunit ribosomal protein L18